MRRLRPQFKPNLGPSSSASKTGSATRPVPPTTTPDAGTDKTPDRGVGARSSEALPSAVASVPAAAELGGSGDDGASVGSAPDKPSPGSRSPRKAVHEGPKSPVMMSRSPARPKSPARAKSPVVLPKSPARSQSPLFLPKSPTRPKSPAVQAKSPLRPRSPMPPKSPAASPKSPLRPKSPGVSPKSPLRLKMPGVQSVASAAPLRSPPGRSKSAALASPPLSPPQFSVSGEPAKASSPSKSLPSTKPATRGSTKPGVSTSGDQDSEKGVSPGAEGTSAGKKASGAAAKPAIRSARARFKPNLVGKRKDKPAVKERPGQENKEVQREHDGSKSDVESGSEVGAVDTGDGGVLSLPQSFDENRTSDTTTTTLTPEEPPQPATEPATEPAILADLQAVGASLESQAAPESLLQGEEEEEPGGEGEGEGVAGGEGGSEGAQEEEEEEEEECAEEDTSTAGLSDDQLSKKNAHDKKVRRSKPVLPSTEKPADRAKMKMSDFIYWNPNRNPMLKKDNKRVVLIPNKDTPDIGVTEDAGDDDNEEEEEEEVPVVQLKLDESGQIILNEASMTVASKKSDSTHVPTEIVEEDDDRFVTSRSFRNKQQRSKKWSKTETDRFYNALSLVGTDFSLMQGMFPSRTRRDLKNKFSKEDKQNRVLIDTALRNRKEFDQSHFDKAREAEAAEMRQKKAMEEEKKRKQMEKVKKERKEKVDLEEKEEDMDEEEMQRKMETEEEERKENSRKRQRNKLCKDESKFPGYKRRRTQAANGGLTQFNPHGEVVEILVNMSCGKVREERSVADQDQQDVDAMSDSHSVVSDLDSSLTSPFVPRVARPLRPPQPSSSSQVEIDPEISVMTWEVPETGPAPSQDQQTVEDDGERPTSRWEVGGSTGVSAGSEATVSGEGQVATGEGVVGVGDGVVVGVGDGGEVMTDISSLVANIQAQASTPVDVVLVEQKADGQQQGWVHVYLVPHIASPSTTQQQEGGEQNSLHLHPQAGGHHSHGAVPTVMAAPTNVVCGADMGLQTVTLPQNATGVCHVSHVGGAHTASHVGGAHTVRAVPTCTVVSGVGGAQTVAPNCTVVNNTAIVQTMRSVPNSGEVSAHSLLPGGEVNSLPLAATSLSLVGTAGVSTEGGDGNSLQMAVGLQSHTGSSGISTEGGDRNSLYMAARMVNNGARDGDYGRLTVGGAEKGVVMETDSGNGFIREGETESIVLTEDEDEAFIVVGEAHTFLTGGYGVGSGLTSAGQGLGRGEGPVVNRNTHPQGSVPSVTEQIVVVGDDNEQREKYVYSTRYV